MYTSTLVGSLSGASFALLKPKAEMTKDSLNSIKVQEENYLQLIAHHLFQSSSPGFKRFSGNSRFVPPPFFIDF